MRVEERSAKTAGPQYRDPSPKLGGAVFDNFSSRQLGLAGDDELRQDGLKQDADQYEALMGAHASNVTALKEALGFRPDWLRRMDLDSDPYIGTPVMVDGLWDTCRLQTPDVSQLNAVFQSPVWAVNGSAGAFAANAARWARSAVAVAAAALALTAYVAGTGGVAGIVAVGVAATAMTASASLLGKGMQDFREARHIRRIAGNRQEAERLREKCSESRRALTDFTRVDCRGSRGKAEAEPLSTTDAVELFARRMDALVDGCNRLQAVARREVDCEVNHARKTANAAFTSWLDHGDRRLLKDAPGIADFKLVRRLAGRSAVHTRRMVVSGWTAVGLGALVGVSGAGGVTLPAFILLFGAGVVLNERQAQHQREKVIASSQLHRARRRASDELTADMIWSIDSTRLALAREGRQLSRESGAKYLAGVATELQRVTHGRHDTFGMMHAVARAERTFRGGRLAQEVEAQRSGATELQQVKTTGLAPNGGDSPALGL